MLSTTMCIKDKLMALKRYHCSLYFFPVGVLNEEMIEESLSIRMKTEHKTWLMVQNTLLVNWIIIVKIQWLWNQTSQEKRSKTVPKVITLNAFIHTYIVGRWYSVKCIMYEVLQARIQAEIPWADGHSTSSWQPFHWYSCTLTKEWLQNLKFI